jgi:hypothetical protein
MKMLWIFLLILQLALPAHGQRIIDGDVTPGLNTVRNYIKNPSAHKNATYGVSTSNATVAQDTDAADKLDGKSSFTCDASAQNGYCAWATNTIQEGDKTGSCAATAHFKGDASLYKLTVTDTTNTLNSSSVLSNETDWKEVSVNYPCGSPRDVRLVQTEAGTGAAVNIGRVTWSRATNTRDVSQAQLLGSITVTGCASNWSRSNTSIGSFSAGASCSYAAIGNASAPSTLIPAIKFSSIPAGRLLVMARGAFYKQVTTTNADISFRFSDGTNNTHTSAVSCATGAGDACGVPTIDGTFDYSTAQGSTTIEIQGATSSTASSTAAAVAGTTTALNAAGTVTGLQIDVYHFPSYAQTGYTPEQSANSWSGYHDNTCSFARTNTAFGDPATDASCGLTERTNTNFGTVTGANNLPSITFTPKKVQKYFVCADVSIEGATAGQSMAVKLWDGTTTIAERDLNIPGTGYGSAIPACGIYSATNTSAKTLSIQTKSQSGAATIKAQSAASAIEWSIFAIDQSFPAPVILNNNQRSTAVTAATYTITCADDLILPSTASNAITLTLPSASACGTGKQITINKTNSGLSLVTVSRAGSDTIGAALTSTVLIEQDETITLQSDGTSVWRWKTSPYRECIGEWQNTVSGTTAPSRNYGSCFGSMTRSGPGAYAAPITASLYSAVPSCIAGDHLGNYKLCTLNGAATTTSVPLQCGQAGTDTAADSRPGIICRGPR